MLDLEGLSSRRDPLRAAQSTGSASGAQHYAPSHIKHTLSLSNNSVPKQSDTTHVAALGTVAVKKHGSK